jgi:hypothetical protein
MALTQFGEKRISKDDAEDIMEQIAPGLSLDDNFEYEKYIDIMFTK